MDEQDLTLYRRQLHDDLLSTEDQQVLKRQRVFILGLGGLGSPLALYLTAAGVGTLVLCDHDVVELSNLNRQVIHSRSRLGMAKTESAVRTLTELNPDVSCIPIRDVIASSEDICRAARQCSVLVDCTDNIAARVLLSRASGELGIPLVHGGIYAWSGQVSVFMPGEDPSLEDLLPEADLPGMKPVIGAAAGVIGSIQASEVIKLLLGKPSDLRTHMLVYDGLAGNVYRYMKTRT